MPKPRSTEFEFTENPYILTKPNGPILGAKADVAGHSPPTALTHTVK